MGRSPLFFSMDGEAGRPAGPVCSTGMVLLLLNFCLDVLWRELCFLGRRGAPNSHFQDNVRQHSGDGCHLRYLSSALPPPWHCLSSPSLSLSLSPPCTCHPCASLIYKVVMAIHSNVISCHINTYISGSYYKACNGGASGLLWGSF